jgi:hypothetical protein
MSILNRAEDWLIKTLLKAQPPEELPSGHPPADDKPIALTLFVLALLAIAATSGHCLAGR